MAIAYAKGARTFERHIDIDADGIPVAPYCSQPQQVDVWFKAFRKAKRMCGSPGTMKRRCEPEEIRYLDALIRGVYAKRDLKQGQPVKEGDVYLAVPLQKGQVSSRELMLGQTLLADIAKDQPVRIDQIDNPYAYDEDLKEIIYARGV
jgi:N-acetylneuraminate synthase